MIRDASPRMFIAPFVKHCASSKNFQELRLDYQLEQSARPRKPRRRPSLKFGLYGGGSAAPIHRSIVVAIEQEGALIVVCRAYRAGRRRRLIVGLIVVEMSLASGGQICHYSINALAEPSGCPYRNFLGFQNNHNSQQDRRRGSLADFE
jgi:hypothetical protein